MTYFDPEPFAYVVDEAEMGKKGEMIEWHYKEWSKGIKMKSLTSKFEKKISKCPVFSRDNYFNFSYNF